MGDTLYVRPGAPLETGKLYAYHFGEDLQQIAVGRLQLVSGLYVLEDLLGQ